MPTPPLREIVAYDVYAGRLPPIGVPAYAHIVDAIRIQAVEEAPSTVTQLVVAPARVWRQRSPWLDVFAFGTFRRLARPILALSEFLAPIYLEYEVLPMIQPIPSGTWGWMVATDAERFQRVASRGLLAFDREQG